MYELSITKSGRVIEEPQFGHPSLSAEYWVSHLSQVSVPEPESGIAAT